MSFFCVSALFEKGFFLPAPWQANMTSSVFKKGKKLSKIAGRNYSRLIFSFAWAIALGASKKAIDALKMMIIKSSAFESVNLLRKYIGGNWFMPGSRIFVFHIKNSSAFEYRWNLVYLSPSIANEWLGKKTCFELIFVTIFRRLFAAASKLTRDQGLQRIFRQKKERKKMFLHLFAFHS